MENVHYCVGCETALPEDDGHDLCPACLGPDHLREGLSDNACMNCSCMSLASRASRLAQVDHSTGGDDLPPSGRLPPARSTRSKRRREVAAVAAPAEKKRKPDSKLAEQVQRLSVELAEMRSLFQTHQSDAPSVATGMSLQTPSMPLLLPEDDVLSLAASATDFGMEEDRHSHTSEPGSHSSVRSAQSMVEESDASMANVLRMAVDRLQLQVPEPAQSASGTAFFRRSSAPTSFVVPPSADYLQELHACWRDTGACSRLTSDGRVLAAMHDAAAVGLDRMPSIEPTIASLIVSPDEAMRATARCPRPQCRVTDDLLSRAYNAGARAGRIGNSLSHLMLALSASLQESGADDSTASFSDASLQAFALLSRELGRMMSFLVQARRQVWLAQAPLSEACRRALRGVPVEPGEMFGSAAQEMLERTLRARQTREEFSTLSRGMSAPNRPSRSRVPMTRPSTSSRGRLPPPTDSTLRRSPRRSTQRSSRGSHIARLPAARRGAPDPGWRPPTAPRGQGGRK